MKKLAGALTASLALTAISASSSSATVSTTRTEWYTGPSPGTTLAVGTSLKVNKTFAVEEHPTIGKRATFKTNIAGLPIGFTSTAAECVECKIQNKEVTEKAGAIAFGEGRLRFKGVTVMEPAETCTVGGEGGTLGEVITKPLLIHADWMDTKTENQKAFVQFIPKAGATATFFQFSLAGQGCTSFEGAKNVFGKLFAESVNNTGVFATVQKLVFSPAVQETAGASLNVGGQPASLTGTAGFSLENGASFAIKP